VPVFKLADAVADAADEPDPTASLQMPIEELRRDEHSKIRVTDGPDGREFFFPAARNPGAAIITSVMAAIFSGIAWLTFHLHAPILFPIVFGFFGALLILFALDLWFRSSRVTIDATGVRAVNRWLLLSRSRRFAAGEVVRFAVKTGMTSGSQVFWNIKLVTPQDGGGFEAAKAEYARTGRLPPLKFRISDPGGMTVAGGIASAPEANWLAREMTRALGRPG